MNVSICIVSYGSLADLRLCLAAVATSAHQNFEVVICENGGETAFNTLAAALPRELAGGQSVHVISAGGNVGFAGGVNACIRESSTADAWWILNPDTEPHRLALARMTDRLAADDCDAVGSVLILNSGVIQSYGGYWRKQVARAVSIGHGRRIDSPIDAREIERVQNYLNGASMLVSRRFVETAGLMREDYFLYCEEVEWCLRAISKGMKLGFAPEALVLHHQGTSTGNVPDLKSRSRLAIYLGERNKIALTRDCFPVWLVPAALGALALILLRYVRSGAWRQLAFALSGWWAGILGERGPSRSIALQPTVPAQRPGARDPRSPLLPSE